MKRTPSWSKIKLDYPPTPVQTKQVKTLLKMLPWRTCANLLHVPKSTLWDFMHTEEKPNMVKTVKQKRRNYAIKAI